MTLKEEHIIRLFSENCKAKSLKDRLKFAGIDNKAVLWDESFYPLVDTFMENNPEYETYCTGLMLYWNMMEEARCRAIGEDAAGQYLERHKVYMGALQLEERLKDIEQRLFGTDEQDGIVDAYKSGRSKSKRERGVVEMLADEKKKGDKLPTKDEDDVI